jgi:hypothetical protein
MEAIQSTEQLYQLLENIDTDDKKKLFLTMILNLEKRLSAVENTIESIQQEKINQHKKCTYCQNYKYDTKYQSLNKNGVVSCDDCYSKIFFNGTSFSH